MERPIQGRQETEMATLRHPYSLLLVLHCCLLRIKRAWGDPSVLSCRHGAQLRRPRAHTAAGHTWAVTQPAASGGSPSPASMSRALSRMLFADSLPWHTSTSPTTASSARSRQRSIVVAHSGTLTCHTTTSVESSRLISDMVKGLNG